MKPVLVIRALCALVMLVGLNAPQLRAQEDSEKKPDPKQTDRAQGQGQGQRGQGGGQRGGGPGGMPNLANMTPEEQAAALNKYRQTKITEMAEVCEIREDQLQAFVKVHVPFETAMLKAQLQMRGAGRDREKRQALMQSMTKASSTANKEMKKVLDKEQMKIYTKKLKERMPQQGQRGGGGGGGQR